MWNGNKFKSADGGVHDGHGLPPFYQRLNVDDALGDGRFEASNRDSKWEDWHFQKKFSNTSWPSNLSQSASCPDFFQKLAAGKSSPSNCSEVDQKHAEMHSSLVSERVKLRHRFCPWDGTEFRHADIICPQCGSQRTRSPYNGKQEHLANLLLPPWERVLWKPQPYEDNYVPRSFLESLVRPSPPAPNS